MNLYYMRLYSLPISATFRCGGGFLQRWVPFSMSMCLLSSKLLLFPQLPWPREYSALPSLMRSQLLDFE